MARKVISPSSVRPAFTTQDFIRGISDFENRMADTFFFYLKDEFKKKRISFEAIENRYRADNTDVVDEAELINSIRKKDQLVFIQDGKAIGELSYVTNCFSVLYKN